MTGEEKYILRTFQNSFCNQKNARICLYGTGAHTWKLLQRLSDYNICGVMDLSCKNDGFQLLSEEEVEQNCDFIVIIARPMYTKKIYTKIRGRLKHIPIYSLEGVDLDINQQKEKMDIELYLKKTEELVKTEQDRCVFEWFREHIAVMPRQDNGGINVEDMYTFVNVFLAPLIVNVFIWVVRKAKEKKCDFLLFPSRDGYWLYQMYLLIKENGTVGLPDACYFYTSRQALLNAEKNIPNGAMDNYRKYLERLRIDEKENIGIYDFCARGTVQLHLEEILQKKLLGLYYVKLPLENAPIEVCSYSGQGKNYYQLNSFAQRYYPLTEMLFSAAHGSVEGIDAEGNPIFEPAQMNEDIAREIGQAIMDCFDELLKKTDDIYNAEFSHELIDNIVDMIRIARITLDDKVKKSFVAKNCFYGEIFDFFRDILI